MKIIYHRQITEEAIGSRVSSRALEVILEANAGQDAIRYQVGHNHFHYDSNAFHEGDLFVKVQKGLILPALQRQQPVAAWQAFGRLSHAVQDFYAHSNYVASWLSKRNGQNPGPADIDPMDPELLTSPELRSGKPHYLFDLLVYLNLFPTTWERFAPSDSHTRMNVDGPERVNFDLVFSAAVKRTQIEFNDIVDRLPTELERSFLDIQH